MKHTKKQIAGAVVGGLLVAMMLYCCSYMIVDALRQIAELTK
jgi:hypothetical protein